MLDPQWPEGPVVLADGREVQEWLRPLSVPSVDPMAEIGAWQRGASYLVRPTERAGLLFSVTLALAEGRPMRRSPRKLAPRFPGLIDGVPSLVLDVSHEGVRLEIAERHRSSLPPAFTLRVPVFNVAVMVQRVWVSSGVGASSQLWCGGTIGSNSPRGANSWRNLVDVTSSGMEGLTNVHHA